MLHNTCGSIGADPLAETEKGKTPLQKAVYMQNSETVSSHNMLPRDMCHRTWCTVPIAPQCADRSAPPWASQIEVLCEWMGISPGLLRPTTGIASRR